MHRLISTQFDRRRERRLGRRICPVAEPVRSFGIAEDAFGLLGHAAVNEFRQSGRSADRFESRREVPQERRLLDDAVGR